MPVDIRGKQYRTVAERVADFRDSYPEHAIVTEIIQAGDVVQVKARIENDSFRVVATGFAEEVRGSTNINKTSALENCETSAIGRALAAFGLGGTEYASSNEVMDALIQQAEKAAKEKAVEFYKRHAEAVKNNWDTLCFIREQIRLENYEEAKEAYAADVSEDDQHALWVAPSKGGFFTTEERAVINGSKTEKAA